MMCSVSLIDGHIDIPKITLWVEGYQCNEGSSTATCLGTYKANSLKDAVIQWASEYPEERAKYIDMNHLTYWGCKFYDNETDARKSFG